MTDSNITPLHPDPVETLKGKFRDGWSVVVEGRQIPRLVLRDHGDHVSFSLDGRFRLDVPRELAHPVASFVANAMAIGAGYPWFGADTKDRPFAPRLTQLGGDPETET